MKTNFPVIEMFHSIQGEGKFMGVPTIFVRVSGCNLRCVFKNSRCDTPYSSFNPEKSKYNTIDVVVSEFLKLHTEFPKTSHIVITGGEPMLYQKGISEFLLKVSKSFTLEDKNKQYTVTIETNGTISPDVLTNNYIEQPYGLINVFNLFFSISPKLSTSVDKNCKFLSKESAERHDKTRINVDNLVDYLMTTCADTQLKFVYSDESVIDEINDLHSQLIARVEGINAIAPTDVHKRYLDKITYLMPEGTTVEHMNDVGKECVEQCIKHGWNFAPRLHILIWGDKRGV